MRPLPFPKFVWLELSLAEVKGSCIWRIPPYCACLPRLNNVCNCVCTHTHYLFNILWIKPKVQRFQYSRHTVANQVVLGTHKPGLKAVAPCHWSVGLPLTGIPRHMENTTIIKHRTNVLFLTGEAWIRRSFCFLENKIEGEKRVKENW